MSGAKNVSPILTLSDVSVSYRSLAAVSGVSFEVARGDCFCIVGENGSGKSSLVKAILGIEPLASGSVTFGVPRDRVAYTPQSSEIARDFPATVQEVVMTGRQSGKRFPPFYTPADREAAAGALEALEIYEIRDRKVNELSGGQLQRTLLARALCAAPELLILDEPEAGLDENNAARLRGIFRTLNRERGITVVMVTHDTAGMQAYANRVAVLNRSLRFCGPVCDWKGFASFVESGRAR